MSACIMYNIVAAYLITILVFDKLYSFQNGDQGLFTTSLHRSQHSKILESPNKHNVMTSFGIKLLCNVSGIFL